MNLKEETIERFERRRRRCVDHFRALVSMTAAQQYSTMMLEYWATNNVVLLAALHSAGVMAYFRPFTSAQTKEGKVQYPVRHLQKYANFDREPHDHLRILRDRIIAHGDYDMLRSTIFMHEIGDEKLPVNLGINVKAMMGIEVRALAERYQAHFSVCVSGIKDTFEAEFKELAAHLRKFPEHFRDTQNLPRMLTRWTATEELSNFPDPTGPAATVTEPEFLTDLSGYGTCWCATCSR